MLASFSDRPFVISQKVRSLSIWQVLGGGYSTKIDRPFGFECFCREGRSSHPYVKLYYNLNSVALDTEFSVIVRNRKSKPAKN